MIEILSFTLNEYKYQAFEFEKGSTGQRLILKKNAGSEIGTFDFTLADIKYVDGTDIKDVKISGNQVVKMSVADKGVQVMPSTDNMCADAWNENDVWITIKEK